MEEKESQLTVTVLGRGSLLRGVESYLVKLLGHVCDTVLAPSSGTIVVLCSYARSGSIYRTLRHSSTYDQVHAVVLAIFNGRRVRQTLVAIEFYFLALQSFKFGFVTGKKSTSPFKDISFIILLCNNKSTSKEWRASGETVWTPAGRFHARTSSPRSQSMSTHATSPLLRHLVAFRAIILM